LFIPAAAQAVPGGLDPSFGQGGVVTTSIGPSYDDAYALAVQPDGKAIAAGGSWNGSDYDLAIVRYGSNGSLDPSFGSGGKVTTPVGPKNDVAAALVLQPDGKVVAAGYSSHGYTSDFMLVRYNANGTLDSGFGSGGKAMAALGSGAEDGANALVLQPDGKLVAAGGVSNGSRSFFALARFNANGSLDTSFGQAGKVTTEIGSSYAGAMALALQPDGKLVAAGGASNGSHSDVALARYNANGTLDPGFGSGGTVITAIGPEYDAATALALLPDGKLVVAGQSWNGSIYELVLARYSPTGLLDPSFGSSGKTTTAIAPDGSAARALAVQPDGKLVAAGYAENTGSSQQLALARFSPNGTLDPSFGTGGKLMPALNAEFSGANALALQPDGRLVAAGQSNYNSGSDFTLVRSLGSALRVAKAGNGSGTVTSGPKGIACGSTCSAPFAAVPVTLTATASAKSIFAGWSGACSGTGKCKVTMDSDRSVTATFKVACVIPKLKGKTPRAAKRALHKARCSTGKVARLFSAKVKKGRVMSSKPGAGRKLPAGARVRLAVSKGKK
jgi:uncharacterized delta-60 repeat protein